MECCFAMDYVDVVFIQESWVNHSNTMSLSAAGKIISNTIGRRPRTCFIYNKKNKILPVPEFGNGDLVVELFSSRNKFEARAIICLAYLPVENTNKN